MPNISRGSNSSVDMTRRELITPDEILTLNRRSLIVIEAGKRGILGSVANYYEDAEMLRRASLHLDAEGEPAPAADEPETVTRTHRRKVAAVAANAALVAPPLGGVGLYERGPSALAPMVRKAAMVVPAPVTAATPDQPPFKFVVPPPAPPKIEPVAFDLAATLKPAGFDGECWALATRYGNPGFQGLYSSATHRIAATGQCLLLESFDDWMGGHSLMLIDVTTERSPVLAHYHECKFVIETGVQHCDPYTVMNGTRFVHGAGARQAFMDYAADLLRQ